MNIDFHAHIYPEDYLKKLEASKGDVRIEPNARTGPHHHGSLESVIYVVRGRARMLIGGL